MCSLYFIKPYEKRTYGPDVHNKNTTHTLNCLPLKGPSRRNTLFAAIQWLTKPPHGVEFANTLEASRFAAGGAEGELGEVSSSAVAGWGRFERRAASPG